MGCDIHLFTEGFINSSFGRDKKWINIDRWYRDDFAEIMVTENEGFSHSDLIDGSRDYDLFYLLAGVRGTDEEKSYPPISNPKGLPTQMDTLIKEIWAKITDEDNSDFHDASYLTLKELKDSGYGNIMKLKGWVYEDEYEESIESLEDSQKYILNFEDEKCPDWMREGMVLKEWDGYINVGLTIIIKRMEDLKKEYRIESDEELRIVFWFDS